MATKEQVADFFEITPRTIDLYIAQNEKELAENVCGKSLQNFKLAVSDQVVTKYISLPSTRHIGWDFFYLIVFVNKNGFYPGKAKRHSHCRI